MVNPEQKLLYVCLSLGVHANEMELFGNSVVFTISWDIVESGDTNVDENKISDQSFRHSGNSEHFSFFQPQKRKQKSPKLRTTTSARKLLIVANKFGLQP